MIHKYPIGINRKFAISLIFVHSGYQSALYKEAANGGVLQFNCSAPARKLKLEKLPRAK